MDDILGLYSFARSFEEFTKEMNSKTEFEPLLKAKLFRFVVVERNAFGRIVDSWPAFIRWFPKDRRLAVGPSDDPKDLEPVLVSDDWEPTDEALGRIAAQFAEKLKKEGCP